VFLFTESVLIHSELLVYNPSSIDARPGRRVEDEKATRSVIALTEHRRRHSHHVHRPRILAVRSFGSAELGKRRLGILDSRGVGGR
jgi:hypothetical protein